jgi:hypothetical protein
MPLAPNRVCVVMGDDRPVLSGDAARGSYPSLAYEINRRFCARQGWDFRYEHYWLPERPWGKLSAYSSAARQHRGASWVKILAITRGLDLGYERVIWIDSDCIFYRDDADWSDFLGSFDDPQLQFAGWLDRPFHDDQPCCGFFALRNSDQVRDMLSGIWNTPSKTCTSHPFEQDEFARLLRSKPPGWHRLMDEPMFRLEDPRQRLLHLANFSHKLRVPEFTRWFEERGLQPHPQGIRAHVHSDLDVDSADHRMSGRQPGPLEHCRRELWGLREAGRARWMRVRGKLLSSRLGPTIRRAAERSRTALGSAAGNGTKP